MQHDDSYISASELAQMGYCERKLAFDARHGARDTAAQAEAKARGRALHARFYEERERIAEASATRGRCFIATLALGDGAETRQLRAFRDLCLRRSAAGRWLIGRYYRLGPELCVLLEQRPRLLALMRALLRLAARAAGHAVRRRLGDRA